MNIDMEKAKATKARKAAEYAAQTVTIDDNWRIIRSDELNWEIQYKGKFQGFYATILGALKVLPGKMLNESAKNSLADIQRMQKGIVETIEKALGT